LEFAKLRPVVEERRLPALSEPEFETRIGVCESSCRYRKLILFRAFTL
jgi:hypothetical protein